MLLFLTSTLTVPKIKDLVNFPNQKYKHIFETLNSPTNLNSSQYTDIAELSPIGQQESCANATDTMKKELKNFLKKQLSSSDNIVEPYM